MPDPNLPAKFDITASDLKPSALAQSANAFTLRGEAVMLAPEVALIFQVETRKIIQNITRNPDIFPDRYAFELTPEEVESLRSAGVISKPGRGGSRALPWAITRKGTLRLATIMKTPRAIQATDIFIDVFDDVLRQVQAGQAEIIISDPAKLVESDADRSMVADLRRHLSDAVSGLLNAVVDSKANTTVADELQSVSKGAVRHLQAWLQGKSIANEKVAAETLLILEQAQEIYSLTQAELAEKALDRERKSLENLRLRIEAARAVMELHRDLEPSALIELTRSFAAPLPAPPRALPAKKD